MPEELLRRSIKHLRNRINRLQNKIKRRARQRESTIQPIEPPLDLHLLPHVILSHLLSRHLILIYFLPHIHPSVFQKLRHSNPETYSLCTIPNPFTFVLSLHGLSHTLSLSLFLSPPSLSPFPIIHTHARARTFFDYIILLYFVFNYICFYNVVIEFVF